MEKRKVYGSIIGITLFVLLMLGLTYAALQWISPNNEETNVKLSVSKSLENFIVYVQGNSILSTSNQKLEQGTDYTSGISATIEFYKKDTNKPIYGRINMEILNMLSATNTTEANISKTNTVKWAITTYTSTNSTETLLNSGTFYGKQINDKFPLYQDFELSTTRTFFKIYIWFDENELDLDKSISNELLSTEISAEASDTIGEYSFPNSPDLVQGLIPVVYDESTSNWVKADSTNTDNSWYNYSDKRWANAVLVSETNRNNYLTAETGAEISMDDILAYYVWIPRFKYKVWNISKQAGAESTYAYNAKTEGIDIIFEEGKNSTGTISCNYNHNVSNIDLSTTTAETCTGNNGEYYTHPAFTFGNDEVRGFWISKFEISSSNPTATNGGGNVTNLTVRSLPNVNSWRNNKLSNFSTVIQNMQISDNVYGLSTSRTNTDSHVLTNYEWGAVAYLTNSKYGRCTDGSCTEVTINNCDTHVTGIGANTVSEGKSSTTCTTAANKYDGTYGKLASITGNITGVYDMSGGSWEYVMGNISKVTTGYTFFPSNSSFASSWYTTSTAKYLTTYAYESSYSNTTNQTAYNRGRLGDATAEVALSTDGTGGWYSDYAYFPYSGTAWFVRGGHSNGSSAAGVFYFADRNGYYDTNISSRAALVSLFD